MIYNTAAVNPYIVYSNKCPALKSLFFMVVADSPQITCPMNQSHLYNSMVRRMVNMASIDTTHYSQLTIHHHSQKNVAIGYFPV